MRLYIEFTGPEASGKTVLSKFLAAALKEKFGVDCVVHNGSERYSRGGRDFDTVSMETSPELLHEIDRATRTMRQLADDLKGRRSYRSVD